MTTLSYMAEVAGCPYLFGTAALSGIDPADVTNADGGGAFDQVAIAPVLDSSRGWEWEERIAPAAGSYEGSPMTFAFADAPGITPDGTGILSYLTTRDPDAVFVTIATTTLDTGDTAFDVLSPSAAATLVGQIAWLDGEAIIVDSVVGSTVTCTRNVYGSTRTRHLASAADNAFPELLSAFTWATMRPVRFFRVTTDSAGLGVATCLWRGYATAAPRILAGSDGQVRFEMQAQPLWAVQSKRPIGGTNALIYPRGFDTATTGLKAVRLAAPFGQFSSFTGARQVYDSAEECINASAEVIRSASSGTIRFSGFRLNSGHGSITVDNNAGCDIFARLSVGEIDPIADHAVTAGATSTIVGSGFGDGVPECSLLMPRNENTALPLDSVAGLPASMAGIETTYARPDGTSYSVSYSSALVADRVTANNLWFRVRPYGDASSSTFEAACSVGGPGVENAWVDIAPDVNGKPPTTWSWMTTMTLAFETRGVLTERVPFRLAYTIAGDSWAIACYGLVSFAPLGNDGEGWTNTGLVNVALATSDTTGALSWTLTGERKLGEFVHAQCAFHGAAIAPGPNGRMRFVSLAAPTIADDPTTVTDAEYVAGEASTFEGNRVGIVNRCLLKTDLGEITLANSASLNRYGPMGQTLEFDATGIMSPSASTATLPLWAVQVAGNLLGRHGAPLRSYRITLGLDRALDPDRAIYCGDAVSLTDFHLPDGLGNRGFTSKRLRVFERRVSIGKNGRGTVTLTLVDLPPGVPYAPCVRVASINGATGVCTLATNYVGGTTDYGGGRYGAGGGLAFEVGDRVVLRIANTTTDTTEAHTITARSAGSITVDTPIGGAFTAPAAGTWVEIAFDAYGSVTDTQQQWAYVADASSRVIDGTTDRAQRIAS